MLCCIKGILSQERVTRERCETYQKKILRDFKENDWKFSLFSPRKNFNINQLHFSLTWRMRFIHVVNHFILRVLWYLWFNCVRCIRYDIVYASSARWRPLMISIRTWHLHPISGLPSLQHRSRPSCNLHHQRLNPMFNNKIQQHWTPKQSQHLIKMR